MKEFQVFNSYEHEKIKAIEKNIKNSYVGFIYILEYGKNIKIGYSKNPFTRIKSLEKQAEYGDCKCGNVAISKPHTNYKKNEKLLHEYFKQHRISGTELFSMTLKQALSDFPDDLKFLDESKILAQKSEQSFENFKKFISGSEITTSHNDEVIQRLDNLEKQIFTPVEKKGQRVLTTAQLAEAYKTTAKTIIDNFNNNKEHYIEGVHYYCLKGDELKAFKNYTEHIGVVNKRTPFLYLWTERGALLHAKSLNTTKAWEVYVFLLENYFYTRQVTTYNNDLLMQIIENQKEMQKQNNALNNSLMQITENQKAMQKQIDDIIDSDNHIIIPFIKGIIKKLK